MARRPATPPQPAQPARLLKPREEVRAVLQTQVEKAEALLEKEIRSPEELESRESKYYTWCDFCEEFLRRAFSDDSYKVQFRASSGVIVMSLNRSFSQDLRDFGESVRRKIRTLESIAGRLDLIDEDTQLVKSAPRLPARSVASDSNKVFIVHGRDEELKAVTARFIDRCGLEAIILHEQHDSGRTIIEKFEQESDVAFAVVLLTGDDVGALRSPSLSMDDLTPRARQNVVFELGFFVGVLGRSRVLALTRDNLELPSDYAGVIYTQYDVGDGWKLRLFRELKAAGLDADPSALL